MKKNAFYFILKALSNLERFTFMFWTFGYVEKQFNKKAKVNFKIYVVTGQYIFLSLDTGSKDNQKMKLCQLKTFFFFQNGAKNGPGRLVPDFFIFLTKLHIR